MKSLKEFENYERYYEGSMDYAELIVLIEKLVDEGRTTGPVQNEELAHFTRLNRQRIRRLDKTVTVEPVYLESFAGIKRAQTWFVITEAWCGDAAQSIPVIEKFSAANSLVETRYLLRDEHTELIDAFSVNGVRSIPKLVAVDKESKQVLGVWGSRPQKLKDHFLELKKQGLEKSEISEEVQRWYLADKQEQIKTEISEFIRNSA